MTLCILVDCAAKAALAGGKYTGQYLPCVLFVGGFLDEEGLARSSFLQELNDFLAMPEESADVAQSASNLEELLLRAPPVVLRLQSQVREAVATIYEPSGEAEVPLKFTAGLILGVPLDCEVSNVTEVGALRICVKYPDRSFHLIPPRRSDLRPDATGRTQRILTSVRISHTVWTESCHVGISIALDLGSKPGSGAGEEESRVIHLCPPVMVNVSPKPARKGI
ncbi:unnamed protein product [Darwinula stevensoni]|uniref:Integrator complex subunit 4/Protein SIEL C-terminal Ig-like domain-containing protein n=1 Tax=Darwinula stevensoni TaxID=69355 RepID=A0A7R8X9C2_9CRUS|nr:unnamed protein product [Darwinula stevensoni]CAG0888864.1 unnamed protein product [Darwinula stevensoni]